MAGLMNPMPNAAPDPGAAPPQASAPGAPAPAPQAGTPPQSGGAAQPGAAPQPGGAPQGAKGPPIGAGPVDPELLQKFIANEMTTVTGSLKQIVQTVTQAQDKVDALAHATVVVVVRVEDSLEQSGQQLNLNMTFNAGAEAITDIADAMQKAGAYSYSQKEVEAAFLRAVDMYRMLRQQQGRLDPAMFQQLLQQMKQQEQAGTLEQSFPGLSKFAEQNKPGAQPQGAKPQGQDDGDGPDSEDAQDQQDDAQMPAPGQNFPAKMLKKKAAGGGPVAVKAHSRKAKTKKPPAQKQGSNDFPPAMLKKGKPAPSGPQFKSKTKGY